MPARIGRQCVAGSRYRWLAAAVVLWSACGASAGAAAADAPAAKRVAPLTAADVQRRQRAFSEFQRLRKDALQFEAKDNMSAAAAAWEKAIASATVYLGEAAEPIATLKARIADLHLAAEEWAAARKARTEIVAIRSKLYGEKDWRVTDARLAVLDVEIRSRLSAAGRRELLQAERAAFQAFTLQKKGDFPHAVPFARQALDIRQRLLGTNHPDTADSANSLAELYQSMRQFATAEPLYREALEITKGILGDQHPLTAARLNHLASLYHSTGQYAKAEPLLLAALEITKQAAGENDVKTATALNNLGELYWSKGEYAKAEPILSRALAIRKKALGNDHPTTAVSLNSLGGLYRSMGQYARAKPLLLQALAIRKKALGENHPSTASTLNALASLYDSTGDYAQAEPLLRQALAIRKRVFGEEDPATAALLDSLASLYDSAGEFRKAEPLLLRALAIRRKALGEQHPETATSLNNLAFFYHSTGQYAKAESLYRQALDIRKKVLGERHPDTAASFNNLASLYVAVADYARAAPLYRQAIAIQTNVLGEQHPDTAASLNNLAELYEWMGNEPKAEPLYRRALEIRRKVFGEEHRLTSQSLNNLAGVYWLRGNDAGAKPLLERALDIRRKMLGELHPDTAVSLNNLAQLSASMGDSAKAERLIRQALEIHRNAMGDANPLTALDLSNLALLYTSMGRPAKAEPLFEQALLASQKLLDQTLSGFAERQQLTFEAREQFYLHCYLSLAHSAHVGDAAAYGYVLKSKGAVTARQSLIRVERRRPELKAVFEVLQTVSTRLANLALASPDAQRRGSPLHDLEQLTEQKERLEAKLAAQSGEFARLHEAARLSPAQELERLAAALPLRAALVDVLDYWHTSPSPVKNGKLDVERRLAAFVVRRGPKKNGADSNAADVKRVELGATRDVSKAVENWRQAALRPDRSPTNGREFLQKLRALIWDKLEPQLVGADTILLSPDGPLDQFPLAALPGSQPGRYLIEERNIVIVPLPRLLPELLTNAAKPAADSPSNTPLLIGDVDFNSKATPVLVEPALAQPGAAQGSSQRTVVRGDDGGTTFPRLPGTAEEVQEISSLYRKMGRGNCRLLSGSAATVAAFRREAPQHRWLHIATHGFFAPEAVRSALDRADGERRRAAGMLFGSTNEVRGYHPGLLSGIVLAGANARTQSPQGASGAGTGRDEGILTALEVADLDLSGVDLVVLSACESGLGRVAGGEGVMGLQRAFGLAGARTCVASLWQVDDAATHALMTEFYTNLWRRELGTLDALRQAQLRMLREYDPKQKKFISRGLDVPAGEAAGPPRGSPYYWAGFVLSGDWR